MKPAIFFLPLLIPLLLGAAGCDPSVGQAAPAPESAAAAKAPNQAVDVDVAKVVGERFSSRIEATGTALPVRESILSAPVSGTVKQILVKQGDRVRAGQIVLRFDRTAFALGVEQAAAGVKAARAASDALDLEAQRAESLLASGAMPKAAFDRVKAERDATAAQVAMAEAGLKLARRALGDTEARAPYDGVITDLMTQVGEYAQSMPPTQLMKIVDISSLEVQAFLPEEVAGDVAVGEVAKVAVESADVTADGEVIFVSDRIQPGARTFEIRVRLENPDRKVKGGSFARIELRRRDLADAILVPVRLVRRTETGEPYVFLADQGKVRRAAIRLGETAGDRVLAAEGLKPGDLLITSNSADLADGQPVAAAK